MQERERRLEELVRAHAAVVAGYLRRRLAPLPRADLDDLLADTFLVAWRRLEDVPTAAGVERAWLLGVARNVCHNAQRSARRRARHLGHLRPLGREPSAEDEAVSDVTARDAASALTAAERELLSLHLWEGLDAASIAVVLGLTTSAAATRLFRARAKYRQLLTDFDVPRISSEHSDMYEVRDRELDHGSN